MWEKLLFSGGCYIQIWESRLKAVNIATGKVFDEKPLVAVETSAKGTCSIVAVGNAAASKSGAEIINPFSHPRTLLKDFTLAEKLLQHVIKALHEGALFRPSPQVVIHPMERLEGGLTQVERRAFRELAAGAGARDVVVHEGAPLTAQRFDFEALKKQSNPA